MKLIIEACDLSGKTYAIERIAKYFNSGFVLKNSYKPRTKEDSLKIYSQYWKILSIINKIAGVIILDRFFPSQAVYSYKRGVDEFNSESINQLDIFCADENYIYIYLDTPIDVLFNRFDIDGDEYIKKEELRTLKARYDEFWEITKMTKFKINTLEKDWLETLVRELLPFTNLRKKNNENK